MDRPNPLQWLWYSFGGRLPQRYREWVLSDVTGPTWFLRFCSGVLLKVMPLAVAVGLVLALLLHGPLGLSAASAGLGLIVAFYYAVSYASENVEQRITHYGYEHGVAGKTRQQAALERAKERTERFRARSAR
ncbi:MAG TPA: DUF5313 family protein [Mycobacteriales bacterium]|jgi:hypothetical protein|nr:DUF5313 family protein [Mycobacteriales bacterium]